MEKIYNPDYYYKIQRRARIMHRDGGCHYEEREIAAPAYLNRNIICYDVMVEGKYCCNIQLPYSLHMFRNKLEPSIDERLARARELCKRLSDVPDNKIHFRYFAHTIENI